MRCCRKMSIMREDSDAFFLLLIIQSKFSYKQPWNEISKLSLSIYFDDNVSDYGLQYRHNFDGIYLNLYCHLWLCGNILETSSSFVYGFAVGCTCFL